MVSLRRLTLLALVLVLLAPQTAAAGRLDRLGPGLQVGLFSPNGEAARDRAAAPFGLRNLYLTGGLEQGRRWAPGTPGGEGVADWLRESDAAGATPVLTYYQLQPACPAGGSDERVRVAATVRDRGIMRNYWRDVRAALKLMGANREELVIFHVEPDGWQYLEQLQGARTRVHVSSTGVRELRGLPDDARGYARAFVRLRDCYVLNVALGWHLSAWGVGQVNPASEANSRHIGRVRAAFLHELGRGFDLVVHDPGGTGFDAPAFARHIALLRTFNAANGLPLMLWQLPTDNRVDWLLGPDQAARKHLQAEREAGVIGLMWDGGVPGGATPGRGSLLRRAAAAYAAGLLG